MSEVMSSTVNVQSPIVDVNHTQTPVNDVDVLTESRRISSRSIRCTNAASNNTPRDFEGSTPKIGGVLDLRNENVAKKVNYDIFCEKLGVCVMNEFKGGEKNEITRNRAIDIVSSIERDSNPVELTDEEKEFHIDVKIEKE